MIDPDSLNVWYDRRLVGYLWRNAQGLMGFQYNQDWIDQGRFAISHCLPLRCEEFPPEEELAHRFFANLLPEGGVRTQVVRDYKIPNTDFDLLRAVGGECAGALSIMKTEQEPNAEQKYQQLSDQDLANLVQRRGQHFGRTHQELPRLSLAGAQDKCPILVKDNCYWLPQAESPSSHILKFELSDYRHLPAYETFTTMLAKAIGLPVVDIQLCKVTNTHYALINRYDRINHGNGQIYRLHQEDFCQALGLGYERKYQADGGPSFVDCYRLIQEISGDPANDGLNLLRWQAFNVLAGNSDGHGKNLSLIYHDDGDIRLAPFYDLVCTRAIERIDYHLAFSVSSERNPALVNKKHWQALADECGVRPRFLQQQVEKIATSLLRSLAPTKKHFVRLYGEYGALQRVEQVVVKQCRRFLDT